MAVVTKNVVIQILQRYVISFDFYSSPETASEKVHSEEHETNQKASKIQSELNTFTGALLAKS